MRLWIDGRPGLDYPPVDLAEKAWASLTSRPGGGLALPVYTGPDLSVRMRFVYALEEPGTALRVPQGVPTPTLAWFWTHILEGLLWEHSSQIRSLHAVSEWGRIGGVEVVV